MDKGSQLRLKRDDCRCQHCCEEAIEIPGTHLVHDQVQGCCMQGILVFKGSETISPHRHDAPAEDSLLLNISWDTGPM